MLRHWLGAAGECGLGQGAVADPRGLVAAGCRLPILPLSPEEGLEQSNAMATTVMQYYKLFQLIPRL